MAAKTFRISLLCGIAAICALIIPAQSSASLISSTTKCKKGNALAQLRVVSRVTQSDDPPSMTIIPGRMASQNARVDSGSWMAMATFGVQRTSHGNTQK